MNISKRCEITLSVVQNVGFQWTIQTPGFDTDYMGPLTGQNSQPKLSRVDYFRYNIIKFFFHSGDSYYIIRNLTKHPPHSCDDAHTSD